VTRFLRTRWTGAGRDSGSLGFGRGGIAVNGGGLLAYSEATVATARSAAVHTSMSCAANSGSWRRSNLAVGVATDSAATGPPDRDLMHAPIAVTPGSLSSVLTPYPCFRTLASCRRSDGRSRILRGYEGRRLAQASRVQRTARTWGEIWHVGGLAMTLRDEAFRLRAPDDFSRIDWLYGDRVA
jgi:hypothetical protein